MQYKTFSTERSRRAFLSYLKNGLGLSLLPNSLFLASLDAIGGDKLVATELASKEIKYFIEINYRAQVDLGTCFHTPSLARDYHKLRKEGEFGVAIASEPINAGFGNFFLGKYAYEALHPHLENIAYLPTCECLSLGSVHGHEALGPVRSPGRSNFGGNGRYFMGEVDTNGHAGGNEIHYSSTPTPATFMNHVHKKYNPSISNGLIFRSGYTTSNDVFYHHHAGLPGSAQCDRFYDRQSFVNVYGATQRSTAPLTQQKHKVFDYLRRVDKTFFSQLIDSQDRIKKHNEDLAYSLKLMQLKRSGLVPSATEFRLFGEGLGGTLVCEDIDDLDTCTNSNQGFNTGEMLACAAKLLVSKAVGSVAVDIHVSDMHTVRTDHFLKLQEKTITKQLSRLINYLKRHGAFENTLILVNTLDGSRSPLRRSTGLNTKNEVLLIGQNVKGGCYGDVSVEGETVYYHRPDDNGNPHAVGTSNEDHRILGKDIYKTFAKLAGVPNGELSSFPDLADARTLDYLIR